MVSLGMDKLRPCMRRAKRGAVSLILMTCLTRVHDNSGTSSGLAEDVLLRRNNPHGILNFKLVKSKIIQEQSR